MRYPLRQNALFVSGCTLPFVRQPFLVGCKSIPLARRSFSTNQSPHEILGIPQGASKDEIKKAYRKLALKYHPDRPEGDEAKFKQISAAYDQLTNPNKTRSPFANPGQGAPGPFGQQQYYQEYSRAEADRVFEEIFGEWASQTDFFKNYMDEFHRIQAARHEAQRYGPLGAFFGRGYNPYDVSGSIFTIFQKAQENARKDKSNEDGANVDGVNPEGEQSEPDGDSQETKEEQPRRGFLGQFLLGVVSGPAAIVGIFITSSIGIGLLVKATT